MGHNATLVQARQELEDLYRGVVDDSVDLTFKDFASCEQNGVAERKMMKNCMTPIREDQFPKRTPDRELRECPSLDFAAALSGTAKPVVDSRRVSLQDELYNREHAVRAGAKRNGNGAARGAMSSSAAAVESSHDDARMYGGTPSPFGEKRPGIPHSNICTLCSRHIYVFRHRCLVCGRVYCRSCVSMGMGDMSEGRKCVHCLGKRFSQRYIENAGQTSCFCRYPATVKQQELVWAEKGPRRSGERRHGRAGDQPNSSSPFHGTPSRMIAGTPQRIHADSSFTATSPVPHHFNF